MRRSLAILVLLVCIAGTLSGCESRTDRKEDSTLSTREQLDKALNTLANKHHKLEAHEWCAFFETDYRDGRDFHEASLLVGRDTKGSYKYWCDRFASEAFAIGVNVSAQYHSIRVTNQGDSAIAIGTISSGSETRTFTAKLRHHTDGWKVYKLQVEYPANEAKDESPQ